MEEEKVLFGNLTVYRERGAHLRRLEQFDKSKACYDVAFVTSPEDVPLLVGRSRAATAAVHPAQAFSDAELALRLQPTNMEAKHMQAVAMYTMCDFERSLLMNYRGYRQRRQPPYFLEGINQGNETMQDCIGTKAGEVMVDSLPFIKKMDAARAQAVEHPKSLHVSRIPKLEKKKKVTQMQARKRHILSRVLAMKYLGPIANDKFFLEDFLKDPRLVSANSGGSAQLKGLVTEALRSLELRQDMLRTQRPYYSIKLAEKSESNHQNIHKEAVLKKEREIGTRTAENMIRQVEKVLRKNQIKEIMALAERMQIFLDKKTPRTLPEKEYFIDRLYRAVGEGYLSQYRLSYSLSERGNRRRIAFLMGLPIGRPQSFDSVIAAYPFKFLNVSETMKKTLETLEMCENSMQRCWLLYELARMLCEQKNYSLAKYYCKHCQREAQDLNNPVWWVNASLVLMSGDMQQGNLNEVRLQIEETMHYVKRLPDPDRLKSFLRKFAELVAQTPPADDQRAISQRERQILSVMNESERVETAVLLKRMSTMPPGRKFIVLPQQPEKMQTESVRRRRRQKGLTVVPGPVPVLPATPHSKTPGLQKFDL